MHLKPCYKHGNQPQVGVEQNYSISDHQPLSTASTIIVHMSKATCMGGHYVQTLWLFLTGHKALCSGQMTDDGTLL